MECQPTLRNSLRLLEPLRKQQRRTLTLIEDDPFGPPSDGDDELFEINFA